MQTFRITTDTGDDICLCGKSGNEMPTMTVYNDDNGTQCKVRLDHEISRMDGCESWRKTVAHLCKSDSGLPEGVVKP
jgi:hypothetical protein